MGVKVTGQFEPAGDFSIVDGKDVSGNITGSNISSSGQIEAASIGTNLASIISGSTPFDATAVSGSWRGALSGSLNIISGSATSIGSFNIVNVKTRVKAIGSSLEFAGNTLDFVDGSSTSRFFKGTSGGAFEAYHAGNKKLETTSTGISITGDALTSGNVSGSATSTGSFGKVVTGEVTASGVKVTGDVTIHDDLLVGEYIRHKGDLNTRIYFTDDRLRFQAGGIDFIGAHKRLLHHTLLP